MPHTDENIGMTSRPEDEAPEALPEAKGRTAAGWLMLLLAGVALAGLGASLGSYDPADAPGHAIAPLHDKPANWLGVAGAYVAYKAYLMFGAAAWLPLAGVGMGLIAMARGKVDQPGLRGTGWLCMTVAMCGLAAKGAPGFAHLDALVVGSRPEGPGGLLGVYVASELTRRFNDLGASLCLAMFFAGGAVLAIDQVVVAGPALLLGMLARANQGRWALAGAGAHGGESVFEGGLLRRLRKPGKAGAEVEAERGDTGVSRGSMRGPGPAQGEGESDEQHMAELAKLARKRKPGKSRGADAEAETESAEMRRARESYEADLREEAKDQARRAGRSHAADAHADMDARSMDRDGENASDSDRDADPANAPRRQIPMSGRRVTGDMGGFAGTEPFDMEADDSRSRVMRFDDDRPKPKTSPNHDEDANDAGEDDGRAIVRTLADAGDEGDADQDAQEAQERADAEAHVRQPGKAQRRAGMSPPKSSNSAKAARGDEGDADDADANDDDQAPRPARATKKAAAQAARRVDADDQDQAQDDAEPADDIDAPAAYLTDKQRAPMTADQLREKFKNLPINFAPRNKPAPAAPREMDLSGYSFPPLELLADPETNFTEAQAAIVQEQAVELELALQQYRIEGSVVNIDTGPVITLFEVRLAPGTKVSRLNSVSLDLARALKVQNIRIVPNTAGRDTVGIEVPNINKEKVRLKELMTVDPGVWKKMQLPMFLGKDASGNPLIQDMAQMPHMLIAGTTGSGKSVAINTIITSFLFARKPDELRMILVDPKMVEMSMYKDIPHLMCPVVTEMAKAAAILEWAVTKMDERYELLAEVGVRNIVSYNELGWDEIKLRIGPTSEAEEAVIPKKLPYIVFVIDELADLMMTNKEVEGFIVRIAQKARAVGIHLILATQRPQANVVTGLIKANMPCRVAFKVASGMDSRIVLDAKGAELLLGHGDMLFLSPRSSKLVRAQGTLLDDAEIRTVVAHLKNVSTQSFEPQLVQIKQPGMEDIGERDPLFDQAVEAVLETQRGSVSLLQRRFAIGYGRASRLIEQMENAGILGAYKGSQARECNITVDEWQALKEAHAAAAAAEAEAGEGSGTPAESGSADAAGPVDRTIVSSAAEANDETPPFEMDEPAEPVSDASERGASGYAMRGSEADSDEATETDANEGMVDEDRGGFFDLDDSEPSPDREGGVAQDAQDGEPEAGYDLADADAESSDEEEPADAEGLDEAGEDEDEAAEAAPAPSIAPALRIAPQPRSMNIAAAPRSPAKPAAPVAKPATAWSTQAAPTPPAKPTRPASPTKAKAPVNEPSETDDDEKAERDADGYRIIRETD